MLGQAVGRSPDALAPLLARLSTIQRALGLDISASARVHGATRYHGPAHLAQEETQLLLRLSWASARCEELRGCANTSISHINQCRALLQHLDSLASASSSADDDARHGAKRAAIERAPGVPEAAVGDSSDGAVGGDAAGGEAPLALAAPAVRPLPLLTPANTIEWAMLEHAEHRQTQQRLLQSAAALLGGFTVQAGACTRASWPCTLLLTGGESPSADALDSCRPAWSDVIQATRVATMAALTDAGDDAGDERSCMSVAGLAPLRRCMRLLHVCWIGLCQRGGDAPAAPLQASASNADGSPPPEHADLPVDLPGALTELLEAFERIFHIAVCVRERASRAAAQLPTAHGALQQEPSQVQVDPAISAAGASTTQPPPPLQPKPATDRLSEGPLRAADRVVLRWLVQLMQALDAYRATQIARSARPQDGVPSSLPTIAAGEVWSAAATRLLAPLMQLVQQAQPRAERGGQQGGDQAVSGSAPAGRAGWPGPRLVSNVVLHYALTAFCKVYLARPEQTTSASLLLLESAWAAVSKPGAMTATLPAQVDARTDGRGEDHHDVRTTSAARTKGGARRQQYESPLAQLCLVTALSELSDAEREALDEPCMDVPPVSEDAAMGDNSVGVMGDAAERRESTGADGVSPAGAVGRVGETGEAPGQTPAPLTQSALSHSDEATAMEGVISGTEMGAAGGSKAADGDGTERDDDRSPPAASATVGECGAASGGASALMSAKEKAQRRAMLDALAQTFQHLRQEGVARTPHPVPGAPGWLARFKLRLRATTSSGRATQTGDVYFTSPEGQTIDSLRKAERALGLEEEVQPQAKPRAKGASSRAAAMLRDYMTSPAAIANKKAAVAADDEPEAERSTVREGWENLLHAVCQHLYGTRAAALNPNTPASVKLSEADAERSRREERRKALQTNGFDERALLLEYLVRLSPNESLGLHVRVPPSSKNAREMLILRQRELKAHLRRLMPAEACPKEGEGQRRWLTPRPPHEGGTPPAVQHLLSGVPVTYSVALDPPPPPSGSSSATNVSASQLVLAACGITSSADALSSADASGADERVHGAALCATLALAELALAEREWADKVCATDLLRLDRGKVAGSRDEKTLKWEKDLKWVMALLGQALRLVTWVQPSPPTPPQCVLDIARPFQVALELGIHARKLWHLQLDASLGPGGALQVTSDTYDGARECLAGGRRADTGSRSAGQGASAAGAPVQQGASKAARSAATLSQHCLRWLLQQSTMVDTSEADDGSGTGESTHSVMPVELDELVHPEADVRQAACLPRMSTEQQLVARASEELALCLRTEADVLGREVARSAQGERPLHAVLRPDCHATAEEATREMVDLLGTHHPEHLVGSKIAVSWPLDGAWYRCSIIAYNATTGKHHVHYSSDGVEEWVNLNAEEWTFEDDTRTVGASASPNSAQSALSHVLRGQALAALDASPSVYLPELSLAARLAVRNGSGRLQAKCLHALAAAQAQLLLDTERPEQGGATKPLSETDRAAILQTLQQSGAAATFEQIAAQTSHASRKLAAHGAVEAAGEQPEGGHMEESALPQAPAEHRQPSLDEVDPAAVDDDDVVLVVSPPKAAPTAQAANGSSDATEQPKEEVSSRESAMRQRGRSPCPASERMEGGPAPDRDALWGHCEAMLNLCLKVCMARTHTLQPPHHLPSARRLSFLLTCYDYGVPVAHVHSVLHSTIAVGSCSLRSRGCTSGTCPRCASIVRH